MTTTTPIPVTNRTGGSNTWATPRDFLANMVSRIGGPITLDLAAEPGTAVCADYFGPGGREEDALTADWWTFGVAFLNPPYSRTCRTCADRIWKGKKHPKAQQCAHRGHQSSTITDWVKKACEVGTSGQRLALLVPARVGTEWFHRYVMGKAARVYFVRGRHRFLVPDGGQLVPYKDPAAFPTLLAYYSGRDGGHTDFLAVTPDGRRVTREGW